MLLSAITPHSQPPLFFFPNYNTTPLYSLKPNTLSHSHRLSFLLFSHASSSSSSSVANPNSPYTLRHVSHHHHDVDDDQDDKGAEDESMASSACAVASAIRRASTSPVDFVQRIEKDNASRTRRLVLPSPDFQRLCIEQLHLFRRNVHPHALLSVYVRPAGSYVMDRLELRRITLYPGVDDDDVTDIVILVGNFSVPTGLRVAESALSNQQVEVVDENRAVVFPMVKNPFVVGFLVAELPMMVEPETRGNRESVNESEGIGLVHYPSPEEAYALSPGFGSGVKSWKIERVKDEPMRMCRFSADQRANAINIAQSLAMAYVMDQKAMLLQQSSWQNDVRLSNLVEQIRGPLSSIRTLSKMLSIQLKRSEISYDIVEDILVQGDRMRDTLQQLQDAVYLTKANIVHYNEETLKNMHNSTDAHESERSQLPNNFSRDGSRNEMQKSSEQLCLNAGARDLEMPLPPLALAPIQHGIRPCNVSDVLTDLVEAVRPLAHKQQRMVKLSEVSDPLQVAVEEPALRQALSNLIEGAMLRTNVGGKVEIVSTEAPAGGTLVVIDDDGPDMHYMYEDPVYQQAARKTAPVDELEEKALVALAKEENFEPSKVEQDHAFLLQLLFWFKKSFRWVNAPPCDVCGSETIHQGMGSPDDSESQYGASRVELYRCKICSRITRFPRYNDPLKLLETRRGRCGEWANCFTFYCRAFGYESRLILDFGDHIWTECFSQLLGRWMHLDPCDGVYDKPLLYEKGWKKKLNYAIAISKDGVCDVTKRYTRKWHEVLPRRNIITEPALSALLATITQECRRGISSQVLSELDKRDQMEREALERDLHSTDDASISLPGRQSGDKEWRKSRLELGSDSLSSSSCPVRKCVDEHVTRIYNAFCPVLSQFVKEENPKIKAIKALEFFKKILMDLKNTPFKMRKASIDSASNTIQAIVHQLLPSFAELLNALSLKSKADPDGRVNICLAGDPVKTSLGLPVVLDALDDMIQNLKKIDNFVEDSLSLPLLKLNRIHSGFVHASGEELPVGIATSAFDGTHNFKWEEPNGAKGCWFMYEVADDKMHELVAYELMSANDVPERDPRDWVVEGSNDGRSSWHLLDKQTSQMFEDRFQRRTFKITPVGLQFNVFRFRFLAVRDVKENSRLQLGSIDLYAKGS